MFIKKNPQKAIILGVGHAQVDAIKYLQSNGWFVIGCSYRNEGPGVLLVDQFELINITDSHAVRTLAKKENAQFVYSIGSDIAMPTIVKVSQSLGLPSFLTPEQADLLHNKSHIREYLAQNQLSTVKYLTAKSKQQACCWDSYPAIIKPVDSQGQRGVFIVKSKDDLGKLFDKASGFSQSKSIIIEEYLDGPEISVNLLLINGKIIYTFITDRFAVDYVQGGIPQSHHLPSKSCVGDALIETNALIEKCLKIIGIKDGPMYFQIKLTAKGPRIIEIAPRLDGCHLWQLIKYCYDVDLLALTFRALLDQPLDTFEPLILQRSAHLIFSHTPPGEPYTTTGIVLPEQVIHLVTYYQEGDRVKPINGILEKTGYMIVEER